MLRFARLIKLKFTLVCLALSVVFMWGFIHWGSKDRTGHKQLYPDSFRDLRSSAQAPISSQAKNKTDWLTPDKEWLARQERVRSTCSNKEVKGQVHGVFTHESGVIYCFVPKAGCTFWKRVFRALNSSIDDPFKISRNLVHNPDQGKGVPYTSEQHNQERYPVRFFVARDPFSRLLSSYLDKFYLPDFWFYEAREMIRKRSTSEAQCEKDFLRFHFDKMDARFGNGSSPGESTANETKCGKYLTFAEFVRDGFNVSEPHWMPVHQICNPCLFNVTHVSHMETFNQDARVILAKMGMDSVLDHVDPITQVNEDIVTIVDYNFHKVYESDDADFYQNCTTTLELSYRLWNNFRWRGYIDPEADYVVPDLTEKDTVKDDLMRQIWLARRSGLENPERMRMAKRYFRERAFESINKSLFLKLLRKYEQDFLLFNYEEARDKLYHWLYES